MLQIYQSYLYDFQRAKYKDLEIIYIQFSLFYNIVVKHRILKSDIQNFDKIGFLIGQILSILIITLSKGRRKVKKIQPSNREQVIAIQAIRLDSKVIPLYLVVIGKTYLESQYYNSPFLPKQIIDLLETSQINNYIGIDQIKHFNKHLYPYIIGGKCLLVLDRYKSYYLAKFKNYYRENNIITLYIPLYLSYLLQPLDIRCFSILKRSYSREIEKLIYNYIYYITKPDFFLAFYIVFQVIFYPKNV